jgi:hypothetical protein
MSFEHELFTQVQCEHAGSGSKHSIGDHLEKVVSNSI